MATCGTDGTDTTHPPTEKLKVFALRNGVAQEFPALHATWVRRRPFPVCPPPFFEDYETLNAREQWLKLVKIFQSDLKYLLSARHHVFWSQVISYKPTVQSLAMFINNSSTAFLFRPVADREIELVFNETLRLILLVYVRLSTVQESEECYFTPEYLGKILYNKYIFTLPSLMDICAVFATTNPETVRTIVQNVIKLQPKYLTDATGVSEYLCAYLTDITDKCVGDERRIAYAAYDALASVRLFIEICPQAHAIATSEVLVAAATFYAANMKHLLTFPDLKQLVNRLRVECLLTVRAALTHDMDEVLHKQCLEAVERYLTKISEILTEEVFVKDYHAAYSIDADIDLLVSVCPDIDKLKIDYLLEALASHVHIDFRKKPKKKEEPKNVIVNYPHSNASTSSANNSNATAAASGVELQSLITQVQDILPHLGSGFVEACLKHYNYSTEDVIAAILESKLPPSIEERNWDEATAPIVEPDRRNVFNHDEFDVMTRDTIDQSRVHRGKKPRTHKNVNALLDDHTEILAMKDKFATLGIVEDNMYDDEYDDTYESIDLPVKEADETDNVRRRFVVPRVLRTNNVREIVEESEEESEEEESKMVASRDAFVQNPEELRARAEERRMNNGRGRGEGRGRGDVVGRGRGRGQSREVVVNREKKGVHKSSGANHHRRDRAAGKRNRGMIPS